MPLPVPRLDDRTWDDLVLEARSLIPRYTPEWTDHNVSDPGITLLELLAWLVESGMFQVDQVPPETLERFLELAGAPRRPGASLDEALGEMVRSLEFRERAVTADEYEEIALRGALAESIARVEHVVVEEPVLRHFDTATRTWVPGHGPPLHGGEPASVGLLVVVAAEPSLRDDPGRLVELCDRLHAELRPRTLVTARLHVVGPGYVEADIAATVARRPGTGLTSQAGQDRIVRFLDPVEGGPEGEGWPFGRAIYRSELYQVLEEMPETDHVEELTLAGDPERDEIPLGPIDLVRARRERIAIEMVEA